MRERKTAPTTRKIRPVPHVRASAVETGRILNWPKGKLFSKYCYCKVAFCN